METPKQLLSKWHVDDVSCCRYRFISSETERQILHYHDFYEVFLTLSDNIVHQINGVSQPLAKGSLVFIRPSDTHKFLPSEDPYSFINLAFNEELATSLFEFLSEDFPKETMLKEPFPPTTILNTEQTKELASSLRELNSIEWDNSIKLKIHTKMLLTDIFVKYFLGIETENKDKIPFWLKDTCEKMKNIDNFSKGITRMTEISGRTYEHLSRSLKKYFGETPSAFINDIRVNYAANMLINSNKTVTDLCYESGFGNISWFYSCFKNRYGLTPKDFRKKYGI
ncbi:MAG: helix-turn-helix domain-containing protein [Bacillota bacterium]|nr:helix-turn-helix domain-containing protein [Bacillota bacterium]